MRYHYVEQQGSIFLLKPLYYTPHHSYQFSGAGCDPDTITDGSATLTIAYMEWFLANIVLTNSFATIAERARNFFSDKRQSVQALSFILWAEGRELGIARIAEMWNEQLEKNLSDIQEHTRTIIKIAYLANIFAGSWLAWIGWETPLAELPPTNDDKEWRPDLTLEEARIVMVRYASSMLSYKLEEEDIPKLNIAATRARFERLLPSVIRSILNTTDNIHDVVEVKLEASENVTDIELEYCSHWLYPQHKDNNSRLIASVRQRLYPKSWYVFDTPENHARVIASYDFDPRIDAQDAFGLTKEAAEEVVELSQCELPPRLGKHSVCTGCWAVYSGSCSLGYQTISQQHHVNGAMKKTLRPLEPCPKPILASQFEHALRHPRTGPGEYYHYVPLPGWLGVHPLRHLEQAAEELTKARELAKHEPPPGKEHGLWARKMTSFYNRAAKLLEKLKGPAVVLEYSQANGLLNKAEIILEELEALCIT